jgi:site-specific DNA-methyltransferase (adenine-specific)
MLVWGYASGFPKSKASLKPAWEPIVMARKPGPLRMLAIDECRIGTDAMGGYEVKPGGWTAPSSQRESGYRPRADAEDKPFQANAAIGRWPANIVLTDPIFDGGIEGVVGGGETTSGNLDRSRITAPNLTYGAAPAERTGVYEQDSGTYSRFFLIPKAARSDREPVLGGLPLGEAGVLAGSRDGALNKRTHGMPPAPRANVHPTVKPTDLMRHLVRLVTPTGGVVLDPFLGSGTTGLAAEMEGFDWIGIEREAEYVAIAEARLNGTQRGLGLESA